MAGRVEGKVAFITGAARGQGRAHAVRLAQEGADIIAVDICKKIDTVDLIAASTPEDLAETADLVKGHNRRIFTAEVDVRDYDALKAAVDTGVEQLGKLDIIVANAGIGNGGQTLDKTSESDWTAMIDINLTGVWKTVKAGVPHLLAGGNGGSIILTSSVGGLKAYPHCGHYVAAKHGVVGLMRTFAVELGAAEHSRQLGAPDQRQHPAVHERRHDAAVPSRPGEPGPRRHEGRRSADAHPADRLGRARGHRQCGAVPGLRRGALRHRRHATDRRRQLPEVAGAVTLSELSIPGTWDQITPAWMTDAIRGHHPDAVVDGIEVVLRDDGTNRRARLALTYSAGTGPATVFAKAVDPAHAELVALTSGLYHEPRLFSSGVVLPLDHPIVYTAIIDEARSDFLMIMEDVVARGADPRDSTRPLTIDQAASGVRGLARLHSAFWGERTTANPALNWLEPFVAFAGLEYAPLEIAHERMGDSVPAEIPAMTGTELFVDIWARYIGTLTEAPQTLLHGDPHIGNTYVLPDDTVGFLDWQMARRGNFSLDLGYFLQGALTIEDRRKGERDLVEEYRNALTLPADEKPSCG